MTTTTLPRGWIEQPLERFAEIERDIVPPECIETGTKYVGLEHITGEGSLEATQTVNSGQLASSKFRFGPEHLLYGKLRPYLRKIARPDFDGICSTDIVPLMPRHGKASRNYLFHYLRTDRMIELATSRSAGANLPRLSPRLLAGFPVAAPRDVEEQERIAAILDKADAIRRKRRQALDEIDALLRSAYQSLVSAKHPNFPKWKPKTFEELAAQHKGSMRTGPFGSDLRHSEFVDEGIAVLGIDNAVSNRFAWGGRRYITPEKYEGLRRYRAYPGDVIVTIMGTTGRSAVVPDDIPEAITTKHLATITLDRHLALPEFIAFAIHSDPRIVNQITRANKGAIMDGLNLGIIKHLEIALPPIEDQDHFARVYRKLNVHKARLELPEVNGDELFNSLAQRAFRGEL